MLDGFDKAVKKHKDDLMESLKSLNEGKRIRQVIQNVDSNIAEYEYYYNAGKKEVQDEMQKLVDEIRLLKSDHELALIDEYKEGWEDGFVSAKGIYE